MVDAEWLLKSHRELLSVEKALQRRIKQLQMDDNENDVIESMELGTMQEAGMPRAQSREPLNNKPCILVKHAIQAFFQNTGLIFTHKYAFFRWLV